MYQKKIAMRRLIKLISAVTITALLGFYSCSESSDGISPSSSDGGSGKGGSMARFTIVGDYLYTVDEWNLKLFNISNLERPVFEKDISAGFGIETIFPYKGKLFLGSESGMYIYDISDAEHPVKLARYEHIYACDPVVVDDYYAYVTLHSEGSWCGRNTNELQIVDITNPSNPWFVKSYDMINPLGLGIDSTTLFLCDEGLKVYDISDVYNLDLKHYFNITAYDVIPVDGLLMVVGSDGLYQYRYANDTIQFLSKIGITPPFKSPLNL